MSIPFTQYLLPDGRRRAITIDRSEEIEAAAKALLAAGATFEAEVLNTGVVSLTCELDDETLAHELCENGPGMGEAVDRLVRCATEEVPHDPR